MKTYLYFVLRTVTEAVEKKAHGFKDSLVHLRKAELTEWPVAIPPLSEQQEILSIMHAIDERARAEQNWLTGLRASRNALQTVLLTGEVRVKPDPEPI